MANKTWASRPAAESERRWRARGINVKGENDRNATNPQQNIQSTHKWKIIIHPSQNSRRLWSSFQSSTPFPFSFKLNSNLLNLASSIFLFVFSKLLPANLRALPLALSLPKKRCDLLA